MGQVGNLRPIVIRPAELARPFSPAAISPPPPSIHPRQIIADLSEDLLAHYTARPLIDKYDVYQHLMDYWADTMQDDCYLIAADGWKAETTRVLVKNKNGKDVDKGWTCDLVPKPLIVARYFAREQEAISAPLRMDLDTIRLFAISKLGWIRQQQKKITEQERETPREYLDRESHYVWGKRYLLTLVQKDAAPGVELKHSHIVIQIRPGTGEGKKQAVLDEWYRSRLKEAVPPLIAKWEPLIGVKVARFFVQRMKTKWGSCSPRSASIRLNTDLARKPRECLEYIVVHEMAHLLEPTHNTRFLALMDQFLPHWRFCRQVLNRLPVRHENWDF